MKKLLLSFALVCFGASVFAQAAQNVNQYGQKVGAEPIETTVQDGILVFKSQQSDYKLWFDTRIQTDAAVFFGEPGYADKIGNGMAIRRSRFGTLFWTISCPVLTII